MTVSLRSKKAIIVSVHALASEAGITILDKGSNAVDATIATTFAISVVKLFSAGIGGSGFLLMHSQTERAPLKAR